MTRRISLALTLHNHQPVGNFGWVIAETFEHAYRPMVDALEGHPGIRVALHYTGPLLAWLRAERPEFIARLALLAERGQIEIVGGGWYEPVLAALPERDRVGQLVRMADELEATFGRRPRGAWLAERVWEPDLPTALVSAGYDWTVLDDAHFRAAAIPEDDLWGSYTTDDQGKVLTVFGTEQGLRYRIPFAQVDDVIGYLRDHATEDGERLGTMGDDGEKFGAWPTTWDHCWGPGRWVERFFEALDANADWLTTMPPSDWTLGHRPVGRVYLPTGSYAEMGEWALPADEGLAFGTALRRARAEHRPEARWLRGAIWRNFQVRYREINDIHKQMLATSDLVDSLPQGPARSAATDHLMAGQSNDCYWHGLFGGIYLPDLRVAALSRLIAAEDLAAGNDAPSGIRRDVDLDGRDEVVLSGPGQFVTVKLEEGGGIPRWDLRAAGHPLGAVMRRRPEAYHETLRQHELGGAGHGPEAETTEGGAPASIHDIVMVKQEGLLDHLTYDAYERRSGLIRILPSDTTPQAAASGVADELGDLRDGPWTLDDLAGLDAGRVVARRAGTIRRAGGADDGPVPVTATRTIAIGGGRLDPRIELSLEIVHRGTAEDAPIDALVAVEWSTMLLGGGRNPSAWLEVGGERTAHDATRAAEATGRIAAGNDFLGIVVETTTDHPVDAWIAPIETVSNSEAGFELVYQGSATLLVEPLRLRAGERWTLEIVQQATVARERFGGPFEADGPVVAAAAAGPAGGGGPDEVLTGHR